MYIFPVSSISQIKLFQAKSTEPGMGVDAPLCDPENELQKFSYVEIAEGVGEIRLVADNTLCLGSGTVTSEAGPYFRRDLTLDICQNFDEDYRHYQLVIE